MTTEIVKDDTSCVESLEFNAVSESHHGDDDENDSIGPIEKESMSDWRDEDFLSFSTRQSPSRISKDELKVSVDSSTDVTVVQPTPNQGNPTPWNRIDTIHKNSIPFITEGINGDMFHLHNGIYRRIPPIIQLHNEIVNFVTLMSPLPMEIQQRESLVQSIKTFISKLFPSSDDNMVTTSVFGSQATGLILPTSDIDIVVCFSSPKPSQPDAPVIHNNPLIVMYEAFREDDSWKDNLSYLELILESRVPLLKFTHKPTELSVDISMDQPLGPQTAALCLRYIDALPPLRYLTIVLKYFLLARGLNEPFSGGLGSYALFLMIVSFLQHREREENQRTRRFSSHSTPNSDSDMNLGALLLDFFELYGLDFNFVTTAISIRYDGHYFSKGAKDRQEYFWSSAKPFSCGIENPLETTMDVGKPTFRMNVIQRSFETAFRVLLTRVADPLPLMIAQKKMDEDDFINRRDGSILSSIIPPTEDMHQRFVKVRDALLSSPGYLNYKGIFEVDPKMADTSNPRGKHSAPSRSNSDMSVSSSERSNRQSSKLESRRFDHSNKRYRDNDSDQRYRDYSRRNNVR